MQLHLEHLTEYRASRVARARRAPAEAATTTAYALAYVEEEQRRRGPPAAATSSPTMGWADLRQPAALLVARVLQRVRHAPRALRGSHLGPARLRETLKPTLTRLEEKGKLR